MIMIEKQFSTRFIIYSKKKYNLIFTRKQLFCFSNVVVVRHLHSNHCLNVFCHFPNIFLGNVSPVNLFFFNITSTSSMLNTLRVIDNDPSIHPGKLNVTRYVYTYYLRIKRPKWLYVNQMDINIP